MNTVAVLTFIGGCLFLSICLYIVLRFGRLLDNLEKRIADLEAKDKNRHTQSTQAALMDAISILLRQTMTDDIEAEVRKFTLAKAQEILRVANGGPYDYKPRD